MNTKTKQNKNCAYTQAHTQTWVHIHRPPLPPTHLPHTQTWVHIHRPPSPLHTRHTHRHTHTHTQNHVHTYTYLWSVPAWGCVQTRARSCSQRTLACFHWSKGCPPCRGTPPSYPHAHPGVPPALCPSVLLLAGCRKLECPVKRQNIHVHTHTYIYTQAHTHTNADPHTCTNMHVRTHTHTN